VSRAPAFGHDQIVHALIFAFNRVRVLDEAHPWRCSSAGLDLMGIEAGYIPDLMILDDQLYREASREHRIVPDQIEMVVEVTSPSNAGSDRRPAKASAKLNKWRGYARVGVPYYLLVDRDPQRACITLYSIPDSATGAYLQEESWKFGETVRLPEHFGVAIPTDEWLPWKSG
jgi:Uma2 family endonuclease